MLFHFLLAPDPGKSPGSMRIRICNNSLTVFTYQAEGDGLKKGVLGRECRFTIYVNDHLGEPRLTGQDELHVFIQAPDNQKVSSTTTHITT